ncbi:hypothetical protein LTV02_28730 [Nocardia yamanashiensis]|uniref:hypothetical protein n=1 Tax=Nocardia yamanashiensis TaxID=209247 RepID=UPI001E654FDE|nr:hypothetical protein [Nocardia yamanashiensis]UGT40001.1 hypothetical protein LTV02_28730 [Nocardia yamanashiensis]
MARAQHYQFAHRLLAHMARSRGAELVKRVAPENWTAALTDWWNGLGSTLPAADRLAPTGLSGRLIERDGSRIVLVTLPEPTASPEAYFAAFVVPPEAGECRYYTLEYSVDPLGGEPYTTLGQWSDGSHINMGPGPAPTAEAFLDAIAPRVPQP